MSAVAHGQGGADPAHLFDGDRLHEHVAPESAVFFVDGDSQDSDFSALCEKVRREPVLVVDFLLNGPEFVQGPFPYGFLDHALFVGQLEIHDSSPFGNLSLVFSDSTSRSSKLHELCSRV